ncbi:peptide MFS transporter [Glaciecola sp. KUL10]|uniref:peptide MFS transporter n=1 Tax=Glaciecola sp. (strain KUL10) TaxID=2161813 RepID=UPI000D78B2EF|nr:peptide MFS transporter [Glaciecola sp. KUL10]GBL04192.1 amino acid/peptide transporter [Glaciecola sp. KUL10]
MNAIERTDDTSFFGHPKGLSTLAFTEMWERMSFYGMRAMLVLFMTAAMQEGGLGLTVATAGAIYGLYTGSVYFFGLPGGWIADRLIGGQKAVFYGGVIIMLGHIILAIPSTTSFFIGLIFVVLGTGLLKPNIGAMVGELYTAKDKRRDSAYTLYYMGINLGSIIGYFVCGWLQVNMGYHWAFGAAAIGMGLGLLQYRLTASNIAGVSDSPVEPLSPKAEKRAWTAITLVLGLIAATTILVFAGTISFNPILVAQKVVVIITAIFLFYFAYIFFLGKLNEAEKKRMGALFLICIASTCFWAGFEQAGSSLNLFGRDYTDRFIGSFEIPPAWFQSANSIFIVLLSPFFAAMWINLSKRMIEPSYSIKCALGLIIMATGFIVMFFAAQLAASGLKVAPYWLVATYFLHTVGELCLSPVALSAVSKLSPRRFAGQMMGVFVLTYSMGNIIAGLFAGQFDPNNVDQMPGLYMQIVLFSIAIGAVLFLLSYKTGKWEKLAEAEK